jgi:hypothetical protein
MGIAHANVARMVIDERRATNPDRSRPEAAGLEPHIIGVPLGSPSRAECR